MILTQANFNRIKENKNYQSIINEYSTLEAFDKHIEETLETKNINILINNIIKIMSIINNVKEDITHLEIKEIILKANLSKNSENFKNTLTFLDKNSDEKIIRINKIIDTSLKDNLDEKIDLLIELENLSKFFYPDFSEKLIMDKFEEVVEAESMKNEQESKRNKQPKDKKKIIIYGIGLILLIEVLYFSLNIMFPIFHTSKEDNSTYDVPKNLNTQIKSKFLKE